MIFSSPCSSFGYYRGAPLVGGQGSGQGDPVAGLNSFSSGQGMPGAGSQGWHPTVLYMLLLVIAEMFVFAFISRHI